MKLTADKIFINAKAYTLEAEGVIKEAIVIKDGKFVFVGTTEEALERYEAKEVIDLKVRQFSQVWETPHLHFFAFCQTFTTVDLGGAKSKKRSNRKAGRQGSRNSWKENGSRVPTLTSPSGMTAKISSLQKEDLDMASTKHPIVIKRVCLHTAVANTMALSESRHRQGYDFGVGGTVVLMRTVCLTEYSREQASKIYDELIP